MKYTLQRALTETQLERLEYLKQIEVCSSFSIEAVEEETEELNDKLHDLREHIHNAVNRGGSYTDDEVSAFLATDHKKAWQQSIDELRNRINNL